MIAYLKGKYISGGLEYTILEVNGIGYKVFTPASILAKLPEAGGEMILHTYQHVREDALQLFGFCEPQDLTAFELLLGVSGVGPKAALGVLSVLDFHQLQQALIREDLALLTKIPGVGKKTAQRLILELKDKFAKAGGSALAASSAGSAGGMAGAAGVASSPLEEAAAALETLGYPRQQAYDSVEKAAASIGPEALAEDLVRGALKTLARF